MHRGFRNMPFDMYGGGWFGWLIPIVLIGIVILAVYMIVKNNRNNNQKASNRALDILNERFAKGEIDEEEYNRRRDHLKD